MLYLEIKNQIKNAMKNKDSVTRDCLKMVVDKARNIQKEKSTNNVSEDISDDVMIQAVKSELKQLNQTKDALKGKETSELYLETEHKMAILNVYLPTQMTGEELGRAVFNIINAGNYANFGDAMRDVMKELRGKADNKLIKETVEKYIQR